MPIQTAAGNNIYETARSLLGTDASPDDVAPDLLGCAETVNAIVQKATGRPVGGGTSTNLMWKALKADEGRWEQVLETLPGDVIISPTGIMGARLEHGHVGIVAHYGVLSNNSENGLLSENYDLASWKAYYTDFGGIPTFFFRCLK